MTQNLCTKKPYINIITLKAKRYMADTFDDSWVSEHFRAFLEVI